MSNPQLTDRDLAVLSQVVPRLFGINLAQLANTAQRAESGVVGGRRRSVKAIQNRQP